MATEYHAAGSKPESLATHLVEKTFEITGVTPEDFVTKHAAEQFDYAALKASFAKHCLDYGQDLKTGTPSMAVDFCAKIIFEVGPDSRKVKKGTSDKVWKFIFTNGASKHVVFVATYKQETSEYKQEATAKHMVVSLKQAGLLAMETFTRLVVYAQVGSQPHILLTPLAGAVFSRDDIPKLAEELEVTIAAVTVAINVSCQSGGHYIQGSMPEIAMCASISATRNLKEASMRAAIVSKVTKQYITRLKKPNMEVFMKVAKYATGGVPQEFQYEKLVEAYDRSQNIRMSKMQQARVTSQSGIQSTIVIPSASSDPHSGTMPAAPVPRK